MSAVKLEFLKDYLETLETLTERIEAKDARLVIQLRIAERSFNFLLDQYSDENTVIETPGMEAWNDMKIRRDKVANSITTVIDDNPELKQKYETYCENLKNPGQLGYLL